MKCKYCGQPEDKCTCEPSIKALNVRIDGLNDQAKGLVEQLSGGSISSEDMKTIKGTIEALETEVGVLTKAKEDADNKSVQIGLVEQVKGLTEMIEKLGNIRTDKKVYHGEGVTIPTNNKRVGNLDMEHKGWLGILKGDIKCGEHGIKVDTKALDTSTASAGAEWVETGVIPGLIDAVYLHANVASKLRRVELMNGSDDVLVDTGDPTVYLMDEATTDNADEYTASNKGTGKKTLTSKKFGAVTYISDEATEDELIPAIPIVKASIARGVARAWDDALINGDTTASHQDSNVTGATDVRKAWYGLRYYALAIAGLKKDLSTFSPATILSVKTALGKYGFEELLWILGVGGNDLVIGETIGETNQGFDKFVQIVGGKITSMYGGEVAVSEKCQENLNASGVYDGTTTNKKSLLCVRRDRHLVGVRREIVIKLDEKPLQGQIGVIGSMRAAYAPAITPSASESTVAIGYNIA